MGIQTWIRNIQQKREIAKARETGKALEEAGVRETTQRTTTGAYVTPTGTVNVSPGGKVTVTPTITTYQSGGGGGSSYIPSATQPITSQTQAQQILQQTPISSNMEKGSGGLRDYQFNKSLQRDIAIQTARQKTIYQNELNAGRMTEAESNVRLNRTLNEYVKSRYEEEGYSVTTNPDGSLRITRGELPKNIGGRQLTPAETKQFAPAIASTQQTSQQILEQQAVKESSEMLGIDAVMLKNYGYIPEAILSQQPEITRQMAGVGVEKDFNYLSPYIPQEVAYPVETKVIAGYKKVQGVGSEFIGIGIPATPLFIRSKDIPSRVGQIAYVGSLGFTGLKQYAGINVDINKEISRANVKREATTFTANLIIPQTPTQVLLTGLSFAIPVARANALAKVIPRTNFVGVVTRKGEGSLVQVYAKTRVGEKITTSLTKELIFGGEQKFLGGGYGFMRYSKKGAKVVEKIGFVGEGKTLGSSRLVLMEGLEAESLNLGSYGAKVSVPAGEGITSTAFIKSSGKGLKLNAYWNPYTKEVERGFSRIKLESFSGTQKQNILGTIKKVEGLENTYSLLGTRNPLLRIYKKGGISQIIKNPNIKGTILINQGEKGVGFIKQSFGNVQRLGSITGAEQISVAKQLASIPIQATKQQGLSINSLIVGGGIKTISTGMSILQPQTRQGQIRSQLVTPKESSFFASVSRQNVLLTPRVIPKESTATKEKTSQRQVMRELQVPVTEQIIRTLQGQQPKQVQRQVLRQQLTQQTKLIQKQILKQNVIGGRFSFIPRSFTWKPIPPPVKFKIQTGRKESGNIFGVETRRKGKWFGIGGGLSLNQAINRGLGYTQQGLAQSYRITGGKGKGLRTPFGYYSKQEKGNTIFIEGAKAKINTPSEKGLLALARARSPKNNYKRTRIKKRTSSSKKKKKKRGLFDYY